MFPYDEYIIEVITEIRSNSYARKATKYLNPKSIIRAVRKSFDNKRPSMGSNTEIILTLGKPNFIEREFIKSCKKAKEPFPVKKIQLKLYNTRSKKLPRIKN